MDVVYHVSGAGDDSGILSPQAFDRRFPDVRRMMRKRDMDYVQFGDGESNVIVKREDADKFNASQVIL